ncbi:hypothetical protein ACR77J_07770 [Tissierella praeacuta]|uniref:hypothetical protein n=1 Tax=Tissierella praeacuta TaxID=43131 RepID=UPI003DA690B7
MDFMYYPMYRNINGNEVRKNREKYLYSYDPYVIWKDDYNKETSHTVYSDRLWQWDNKRFDQCCQAVWGDKSQHFGNRKPKDIEGFLILYFAKDIKLTAILEGCNVANGYPYWVFYYEET